MEALIDLLAGSWNGRGRGEYPTIEDFIYTETVTFERLGEKPILAYTQHTAAPDGRPLHAESGYFRFADRIEVVIAQPTGVVECHQGRFEGSTLALEPTVIATTPTAVRVDEVRRTLCVVDDTLSYRLDMAAVGHPLGFHLEATLLRS